MSDAPPLPDGFVLDSGPAASASSTPPPPDGFVADQTPNASATATPQNYLPAIKAPDGVAQYDEDGAPLVGFTDDGQGNKLPQYGVKGQPGSKGTPEAPDAPPPATVGRELGVAAHGALEGISNLGDLVARHVLPGGGLLSALGAPTGQQVADQLSTAAGLPDAQTDNERLLQKGSGAAATALATGGIGEVSPILSLLSGSASGVASEFARQHGYGALGQLIAGLAGGAVPSLASSAVNIARNAGNAAAGTTDSIADTAARLGVTPTPATVGGNAAAGIQKMLSVVPGGAGAVRDAAHNEVDQLANATRQAAQDIGQVGTRESAGQSVVRGAQAYQRATATQGGALYRARDAAFGGQDAPVSVDNFRQNLAQAQARYPTSPAIQDLLTHPAVARVANALPEAAANDPDAGIMTLGEATDALSHLRYVLRTIDRPPGTPGAQPPVVVRSVRQAEQALEDDVTNAAQAADQAAGREAGAPGSAVAAQRDADAYWAQRSQALSGPLKKAMASAADDMKVSPETVYNGLASDAQRVGGNIRRFREAWFRLPTYTRNNFAATYLDDLGRARSGAQNDLGTNWSFDTFINNWDKMQPQARAIMFGGREQSQTIDDIARYASRLKEIGAQRNFSNTASHALAGGFWATFLGHALGGEPLKAGTDVVGALATRPVARVFLATPAMRSWTRDALRTTIASSRNQINSPAPFVSLTRRLTTIAANDPEISRDVLQVQQRLGGALIPQPVAAADRKRDRQ